MYTHAKIYLQINIFQLKNSETKKKNQKFSETWMRKMQKLRKEFYSNHFLFRNYICIIYSLKHCFFFLLYLIRFT